MYVNVVDPPCGFVTTLGRVAESWFTDVVAPFGFVAPVIPRNEFQFIVSERLPCVIAVGTAYAELLDVCTFVCVPFTAWLVFAVPASSKHPYAVPARLTDRVTFPRYGVTVESHSEGAGPTLAYSDWNSPGRR